MYDKDAQTWHDQVVTPAALKCVNVAQGCLQANRCRVVQHACKWHPDSEHGLQAQAKLQAAPTLLSRNEGLSCLDLGNASGTEGSTKEKAHDFVAAHRVMSPHAQGCAADTCGVMEHTWVSICLVYSASIESGCLQGRALLLLCLLQLLWLLLVIFPPLGPRQHLDIAGLCSATTELSHDVMLAC